MLGNNAGRIIEGSNGEIDWCTTDDDMDFEGFLVNIDAIFYGKVSYHLRGNNEPPIQTL